MSASIKFCVKSLVLVFVLGMILSAGAKAHAGLLFEPYVGYGLGSYKFRGSSDNPIVAMQDATTHGNIDGFAYGAKAGLMFSGYFLGAEYQALRGQKKQDGLNESISWNNSSLFAMVGLQFGMGLRLSAGMTVDSVMPHRSEESTEPERTIYTGQAQKLSVGFRYRMPIALNVDYIQYKFEKLKQADTEVKIKERYSKSDYSTIMVSISFPFDI